jgi:uncharacterized protein
VQSQRAFSGNNDSNTAHLLEFAHQNMQTLIYLHGFRSAAASTKARALDAALKTVHADWEYVTPNLSFDPAIAFTQIEAIIARSGDARDNISLIGSSLGGFYAMAMAEKFGCRAVLLNPSLRPCETLATYVGTQTNLYLDETFDWTPAHLQTLRDHAPAAITNHQRYLVIVEMGDELLDHQITLANFADAKQIVMAGGSHDLASFPTHISAVLRFVGLADSEV